MPDTNYNKNIICCKEKQVSVPREQNQTNYKTSNYSLTYEIASLNPGNLEGQVRNFIGFPRPLMGGRWQPKAASQPLLSPRLERGYSSELGCFQCLVQWDSMGPWSRGRERAFSASQFSWCALNSWLPQHHSSHCSPCSLTVLHHVHKFPSPVPQPGRVAVGGDDPGLIKTHLCHIYVVVLWYAYNT